MNRSAALMAALGGVALSFGLLSAGVAVFQPVSDPLWIVGNLAVGVALLGAAVLSSFDRLSARLRSGEARRLGRHGSSAIVGTLAGLVVIGLLGFLSTRYTARSDWSEAGVNTLTTQTLGVLARLDRDVVFTAIVNELEVTPIRELLRRYERASEHLSIVFADPLRRPDLVAAFELDERSLSTGVVHVATDDASLVVDSFDESTLTNALLKLTRESTHRVYFVTGHNERPIAVEGEEGDKEAMTRAAQALRNERIDAAPLVLASVERIPDDASAIIVAGPTRPLGEHEHELLRAYVARGGALMVLVDPRARTDLYADLAHWGVRLGDDVVVDQRHSLFPRPMSPFAASYSETHPITNELKEVTLFDVARSLEIDEAVGESFEVLVRTSDDSWAERDLEGWTSTGSAAYGAGDLLGPIALAVAGQPRVDPDAEGSAPGRLVVFGDSDFASDEYIDSFRNRDLFLNAVQWLVGDVESIAIRPPSSRISRFQLTSDQLRRIQLLSLLVLPEAIAIAGAIVWWSRRRGGEA